MMFGKLLDALEITDGVPSAMPEILSVGFEIARFGRDLVGMTDNPVALGRALTQEQDFFHCRSGLLDSHRVVFILEDIVAGQGQVATALTRHLQWMIDSRRNPGTIRGVLAVFREGKRKSLHADLQGLSPEIVAKSLEVHLSSPDERDVAKALIEGHLAKVPNLLAGNVNVSRTMRRTIRRMYVYWCLFDLQVMAARLFHAEWNALENGGMQDPQLVTVASVSKMLQDLLASAEELEVAFKKGLTGDDLETKVKTFIEEHGLEGHAKRNAALMGIDPDKKMSRSDRAKFLRFLNDVKARARHVATGFKAAGENGPQFETRIFKSRQSKSTVKEKRSIGKPDASAKRLLEANASTSTIRFSVPVLAALTYSIQRVVDTMAQIPAGDEITSFDGSPTSSCLISRASAKELKGKFIPVYRGLFTRDHRLKRRPVSERTAKDRGPPLMLAEEASSLPSKYAETFGLGIATTYAADDGSVSYNTIADANAMNAYRDSDDPENEFIDWVFEASLTSRLKGEIGLERKSRLSDQ